MICIKKLEFFLPNIFVAKSTSNAVFRYDVEILNGIPLVPRMLVGPLCESPSHLSVTQGRAEAAALFSEAPKATQVG